MAFERFVVNLKGKFRRKMLEGRPHLVVPAVMLQEGVVPGSGGPIFYPDEELEKDPHSWDHMPIVIDHPKIGDTFVSARTPEFTNSRKVGLLLNTQHDGKLKTECWFDEQRTKQTDKRVYKAIINGKGMEVSTGLDLELEEKKGMFNGTKYSGVARDLKPDHLAILPDELGACRGAGLFANAKATPDGTMSVLMRSVKKALRRTGVTVGNEMSFSDISSSLCDLLAAKYGEPGKYWGGYILEVNSSAVVFSNKGQLYKMEYTAADKGVTLKGNAVPVVRTVEYKVANEATDDEPNPNVEDEAMFDKKAHVKALIANGQGWGPEDKDFLLGLPDDKLKKIKVRKKKEVVANSGESAAGAAGAGTGATKTPDSQPAAPQAPAVGVANGTPANLSREQLLGLLGKDFMMVHNQGMKALNRARTTYVNQIKENPNNKFTDAALAEMDIDTLAAMAELGKGVANSAGGNDPRFVDGFEPDYGAAAGYAPPIGVANANDNLEEPPLVPDDHDDDDVVANRRKKRRKRRRMADAY